MFRFFAGDARHDGAAASLPRIYYYTPLLSDILRQLIKRYEAGWKALSLFSRDMLAAYAACRYILRWATRGREDIIARFRVWRRLYRRLRGDDLSVTFQLWLDDYILAYYE